MLNYTVNRKNPSVQALFGEQLYIDVGKVQELDVFDRALLTPAFCSIFRGAKLVWKGSGVNFGDRSGENLGRLGNVAKMLEIDG